MKKSPNDCCSLDPFPMLTNDVQGMLCPPLILRHSLLSFLAKAIKNHTMFQANDRRGPLWVLLEVDTNPFVYVLSPEFDMHTRRGV